MSRSGEGASSDLLVVGAGPAGLSLAIEARLHGLEVRLVERRRPPWRHSAAVVVDGGSLDLLAPSGVGRHVVELGEVLGAIELHTGHTTRRLELAPRFGPGRKLAQLWKLRQAELEEILAERLVALGGVVERGVELVGLRAGPREVIADLRGPDGEGERARAAYLVGCDGASSTVRRLMHLRATGSVARSSLFVADVDAALDASAGHLFVSRSGTVALLGSGERAAWRLVALRSPWRAQAAPASPAAAPTDRTEVARVVDELTAGRLELDKIAWTAALPVAHHLAAHFGDGRVFLAGEAAHLDRPAFAEALSGAVADATNLSWKIAFVHRGGSPAALLDSYESERRPVARRQQHLATLAIGLAAEGRLSGWVRAHAIPGLARMPGGSAAIVRALLAASGASRVGYKDSPLTVRAGSRGRPEPGSRLFDGTVLVEGTPTSVYELVTAGAFTLVCCGPEADFEPAELDHLRRRHAGRLRVERVDSSQVTAGERSAPEGPFGFQGSGQLLVRPDGYVALRVVGTSLGPAEEYLGRWLGGSGLSPLGTAVPPEHARRW